MPHVILVHRYFAPDTPPYASILRELAEHFGTSGYEVTVLTCQPSYNRRVVRRAPRREQLSPHVRVVRFPVLDDRASSMLKTLNLVWFCLCLVVRVSRIGPTDVVMAASTPPVAVAATAAWLARRKGAAFIYHKQDIYPEVVVRSRPPRLAHKVMRHVDAHTDRRASKVVVLSRDMARTTALRGVKSENVSVINNFDPWQLDALPDTDGDTAVETTTGDLTVVFAGNLGRFQGLEELFRAAVTLQADPVRFHFFGDGPLRAELEKLVAAERLSNIEVHGYTDPSDVARFLKDRADLGIVSLTPGVIRCAYPSKTLSYLRNGTPILAIVEGDSELAGTVRAHRIGLQAEPGCVTELVSVLRGLAHDRSQLVGANERARELYEHEFGRARRMEQWSALLMDTAVR